MEIEWIQFSSVQFSSVRGIIILTWSHSFILGGETLMNESGEKCCKNYILNSWHHLEKMFNLSKLISESALCWPSFLVASIHRSCPEISKRNHSGFCQCNASDKHWDWNDRINRHCGAYETDSLRSRTAAATAAALDYSTVGGNISRLVIRCCCCCCCCCCCFWNLLRFESVRVSLICPIDYWTIPINSKSSDLVHDEPFNHQNWISLSGLSLKTATKLLLNYYY